MKFDTTTVADLPRPALAHITERAPRLYPTLPPDEECPSDDCGGLVTVYRNGTRAHVGACNA